MKETWEKHWKHMENMEKMEKTFFYEVCRDFLLSVFGYIIFFDFFVRRSA